MFTYNYYSIKTKILLMKPTATLGLKADIDITIIFTFVARCATLDSSIKTWAAK